MLFTTNVSHNEIVIIVGSCLIWFIIFWIGIGVIILSSANGWVIFGAFVTWILTAIIAGAICNSNEELAKDIVNTIKLNHPVP